MELVIDKTYNDAWEFLSKFWHKKMSDDFYDKVEKIVDGFGCDEEVINHYLDKRYPFPKFFALNDYIWDGNNGYFRVRVWRLK